MKNRKTDTKQQQIGRTIGTMVCVMLGFGILLSVALCVVMFRGLVLDQLEDNCVNGTNVLAYHLERMEAGEDLNGLLDALKEQTGCEFTIFEGTCGPIPRS